jgi:hypothetical protein
MRRHRVKNKEGKLLTNQTTVIVDITIRKTALVRAAEHKMAYALTRDADTQCADFASTIHSFDQPIPSERH